MKLSFTFIFYLCICHRIRLQFSCSLPILVQRSGKNIVIYKYFPGNNLNRFKYIRIPKKTKSFRTLFIVFLWLSTCVLFFSGSFFQPSSKVCGYWKGTPTSTHAADGRKHESSQPLRVQPVRSLRSLRTGKLLKIFLKVKVTESVSLGISVPVDMKEA